jgi:hypothetical protein
MLLRPPADNNKKNGALSAPFWKWRIEIRRFAVDSEQ